MTLGILCGLESEAVIARRIPGALVACAGARPEQARPLTHDLLKRGAKRLISFGIAGGLDAALPLGSLIIGTEVASKNGRWVCDAALNEKLHQKLPHAVMAGVYGSETLIGTAREKGELFRRYACHIVDMESQCLAEVASGAGVPFTVIRSVCDSATMDVPEVVMTSINVDGSVNYAKAITSILKNPTQIPHLWAVGHGTAKALKALRGVVLTGVSG